jgi:hypothetical protein
MVRLRLSVLEVNITAEATRRSKTEQHARQSLLALGKKRSLPKMEMAAIATVQAAAHMVVSGGSESANGHIETFRRCHAICSQILLL